MKRFRAHPLMILSFVKPGLILLLLPVVKGIIQFFVEKNIDGVIGLEIFTLSIILLIAVLRWRSYSLVCDKEKGIVLIEYGFIFKRMAKIDIAKISSVQNTQQPIDCGGNKIFVGGVFDLVCIGNGIQFLLDLVKIRIFLPKNMARNHLCGQIVF